MEKLIKTFRVIEVSKLNGIRNNKQSSDWVFQYKNIPLKINFVKKILTPENWYLSTPTYKTKKEAEQALKRDMKRTIKRNSNIKFIKNQEKK